MRLARVPKCIFQSHVTSDFCQTTWLEIHLNVFNILILTNTSTSVRAGQRYAANVGRGTEDIRFPNFNSAEGSKVMIRRYNIFKKSQQKHRNITSTSKIYIPEIWKVLKLNIITNKRRQITYAIVLHSINNFLIVEYFRYELISFLWMKHCWKKYIRKCFMNKFISIINAV